jgi:hypothetical protein
MIFFSDHRATNFTRLKTCKIATATEGELSSTCIMIYYYDSAIFVIHKCILILTIIFFFFRAIRHLKLFESMKFNISFCPDISMTHVIKQR